MNANFFQDSNQVELEIFEPKKSHLANQYKNFKVGNHVNASSEEVKSEPSSAANKTRKTKADRKVAFEQN